MRRWLTSSGPYVAQAVTLLALLYAALQLWRFDFHVRFNYHGDSLWFAVLAKSISRNAWAYSIPQLSAPFGLSAAAFPTITNVDWLAMKVLSLFVKDPAVLFNVFWLSTIFATGWSCLLALRLIGIPSWFASLGGLLYACIPFMWLRSTEHLSLVFYAVPLLCVFAIYLVRGPIDPWTASTYRRVGLVGALVQGFAYVYFSCFGILLFAVAGILGYAARRQREIIVWAAIGIAVLGTTSLINLAPSFYSWHTHGRPKIDYKVTLEAERYGLKLRRLLLPHEENPIAPLRSWAMRDREARFPNENENRSARLGLFGALGFLFLLWVLVGIRPQQSSPDQTTIRTIAALNLIAFLITTVGGFGAIINTLTVPDIRAYNRFSVFIAFFSIAGLSLWFAGRWREIHDWRKPLLAIIVLIMSALSLYDQALEARRITGTYDTDKKAAGEVRTVVGRMETIFPERTAIFQFPITEFPADPGRRRMMAYDHSRPYLETDHFRWSWPALTPRHIGWTRFVATLQGPPLVRALAAAGFGAVWVDRFGYRDGGRAIGNDMVSGGAIEVLAGVSRRYSVFDIRSAARALPMDRAPTDGARALERP